MPISDAIQTRLAIPSDMARIVLVVNAAFAIETFIEGQRITHKEISEMAKKGEFLIAEDAAGRIVASVYLELRGQTGYFGMLAVDPAQQGTGIGRAMVNAAENYFARRGCNRVDITVLSLRPELPPFYRKLGYRQTGVQEFRPSRPLKRGFECHCIVMSKPL